MANRSTRRSIQEREAARKQEIQEYARSVVDSMPPLTDTEKAWVTSQLSRGLRPTAKKAEATA